MRATAVLMVVVTLLVGCTGLADGRLLPAAVIDVADDAVSAAQGGAGCGAPDPPSFSDRYVPIEDQRGVAFRPPIMLAPETTVGAARDAGFTARLPGEVSGLSLRYQAILGDELLTYYSDRELTEDDTMVDLMADGGLMIIERATLGEDVADAIAATLGDRAERVAVGSTSAVMTRSDELAKGVRPYQVAWTDQASDWRVISGSADPAVALEVARSIACG